MNPALPTGENSSLDGFPISARCPVVKRFSVIGQTLLWRQLGPAAFAESEHTVLDLSKQNQVARNSNVRIVVHVDRGTIRCRMVIGESPRHLALVASARTRCDDCVANGLEGSDGPDGSERYHCTAHNQFQFHFEFHNQAAIVASMISCSTAGEIFSVIIQSFVKVYHGNSLESS